MPALAEKLGSSRKSKASTRAARLGLRWLTVTALAAAFLLGLEYFRPATEQPNHRQPTFATARQAAGSAKNYHQALEALNLHLASATSRADALDDGWLIHEIAARAWLFRARLTGSYDDYTAADAALRRSEGKSRAGTGPHMTGAILSFGMHRLDAAEEYLDHISNYAVPPDPADFAETRALRGDIAFYRGDYTSAMTLYDEADRIAPGTASFRRVIFYSKTGGYDLGEHFIDQAERQLVNPTRQTISFLELHRGILDLDRGRLDEALRHFRRADSIFPGHWLVEEHIAEVEALSGNLDTAERLYRDIVNRTGHPEFMDALAGVAKLRGDATAEQLWTERAASIWTKRLEQFPEAAYGHALDHCINKKDWACAVALAERNHQVRPYGDAKIAWAQALLGSGRPAEAKALIDAVLSSSWRTAELHRTAADVYAAQGMAAAAAEQDGLARRLNPLI